MKILTFNTCLLPEYLNIFNPTYKSKENNIIRTLKIHKLIKKLDPDIIFLQEIYDQNIFKILINLFKKDGYKFSHINDKNKFVINGIVTLSKFEILETEFINYESESIDIFAYRGLLINKIKYNDKIINLINVHLQNKDTSTKNNLYQIEKLMEYLKTNNQELFICGGDFNNTLNIEDFYYTKDLVSFIDPKKDESCVDYIITNSKDFENYISVKNDLSDHFYVLVELNL